MIRFLRERGINMHFENEKLDSIEADKEFEITLRGMLAQDESRNISESIKWGCPSHLYKMTQLLTLYQKEKT